MHGRPNFSVELVTCEKLETKQNCEVDSLLVVTYVTPTQDNNEAISTTYMD